MDLKKKIRNLAIENKSLNEQIKDLIQKGEEKEKTISELQEEIKLQDEKINELQTQIKLQDEKISELQEQIKLQDEKISELQIQKFKDEQEISELKNKIKELMEEIQLLRMQVKNKENALSQLDKKNETISELRKQIKEQLKSDKLIKIMTFLKNLSLSLDPQLVLHTGNDIMQRLKLKSLEEVNYKFMDICVACLQTISVVSTFVKYVATNKSNIFNDKSHIFFTDFIKPQGGGTGKVFLKNNVLYRSIFFTSEKSSRNRPKWGVNISKEELREYNNAYFLRKNKNLQTDTFPPDVFLINRRGIFFRLPALWDYYKKLDDTSEDLTTEKQVETSKEYNSETSNINLSDILSQTLGTAFETMKISGERQNDPKLLHELDEQMSRVSLEETGKKARSSSTPNTGY